MMPLVSWLMVACPAGMVWAGDRSCIDVWPMSRVDGRPVLGLSALPETYLDLRGETWDLEEACASRGARMCTAAEWQHACEDTPRDACPSQELPYRVPDWSLVARRDAREMMRLDRSSSWHDYPSCVGQTGARMMGAIEEWVRTPTGYAFSRGFWSREGGCGAFVSSHDPRWHDYATGGRCCIDIAP